MKSRQQERLTALPLIAASLLLTTLALGCSQDTSPPPDTPSPEASPEASPEPEPLPHTLDCDPQPLLRAPLGHAAQATLSCRASNTPDAPIEALTANSDNPSFTATLVDPGNSIQPGADLSITLTFTPDRVGPARANLTLNFNSLGDPQAHTLTLDAEGLPGLDWDPTPSPPTCRADLDAPLLDRALASTNLDRDSFTFTLDDLRASTYFTGGFLDDEFLLSWFEAARAAPARAGCLEGQIAGALDQHLQHPHPVAATIRHAARLLDRPPDDAPPFHPDALPGTFDDALNAICALDPAGCSQPTGALPPGMPEALAPLMWAILEGLHARRDRDPLGDKDAEWWRAHGGNGALIAASGQFYDLTDDADRAYLLGLTPTNPGPRAPGRERLYRAASQIAFALESIDWLPFTNLSDFSYNIRTPAGTILLKDARNDLYTPDGRDLLLLIDLGGDDTYQIDIASNTSATNAVSLAIDLAGNDRYTYAILRPGSDGLLPPDEDGRYRGDDLYGPVSLSTHSRQGAARNGIAMLFDLGDGDDTYQSLVASQGYAHQGVGVLLDTGGDDTYLAEAGSQGVGQFGIGLKIDLGQGRDSRRAFTLSQGFGYVGGAGFLLDDGGDDQYTCDHGDPAFGGTRLYHSPQLPQDGNSSFCQGAGFGRRGQSLPAEHLSGGLGVLRDLNGDDTYEASVFAQGTGYWQGTGILSDADGADTYDASWYIQGGAAHYAIGILADGGLGDDVFGAARPARNVTLGSGHDYSLGALISEGGDDTFHMTSLSAGASNCNGIGLFVDNAGDDHYIARSDYSSGMGNVSGECLDARPQAVSIGVMLDAAGLDTYDYPDSPYPTPDNDASWGHTRNNLPSEHGAGLDDTSESGVHPESNP